MKSSILVIFISLLAVTSGYSQKKVVQISFEVGGVCEMCEKRIEKAVDTTGVKFADYNLDNHMLTIAYRTDKITEEEIHKILNAKGHDTEKSKASDEQYDKIHHCCKYREHEHNH